jgi:hypothetical protein
MSQPQQYTCQERPFLGLEPGVVFDVVGVGEDGVEREEGGRVGVEVEGKGSVEMEGVDFRGGYTVGRKRRSVGTLGK